MGTVPLSDKKSQFSWLTTAAKKNNDITEKIAERIIGSAQIWFTLIAPIIIGCFTAFFTADRDTELSHTLTITLWVMGLCLLLVHIVLSGINHSYNTKHSLYAEILEMRENNENEVAELRGQLAQSIATQKQKEDINSNQIATLSFSAHATDMAIGNLKKIEEQNKKVHEEEFWEVFAGYLNPILYPLVIEREALFGFKSESKYNIALYFYDNDESCLDIVWRDCDSRLPQRNRKWEPGHGHVGLAFLHKEVKFCPDIRKSTELTPSYTQGDNENYRSFISIPILRCEDNGSVENKLRPLGVLVLTSAQAEQFSKERDLQFLTIISKHLAIYLAAIDTFITHTGLIDSTEQSRVEQ